MFLFVSAYSQTTGSIGGTVVDEQNQPVMGAIVKVLDKPGLGAETDASGDFVILNVDVGTYTIDITYGTYSPKRIKDIKVSVDQKTKLGVIQLQTVTTEIVEVTAERKGIDVEQSGRQINQEQIENSGIRGITNLVAKTSGVVQDERGGQINIRGGRTSENLIIVDGVSTSNPLDGTSTASVPNSLLQEISVLTGGFGAEYGNALSGVINVTTKGGSSVYSGSIEAITDAFAGNWIKTTSQQYNLYNVSIGGPLIPTKNLSKIINFYGSVERQYLGVRNPSWIADKVFPNGIIPNYNLSSWSYSGRLSINLTDMKKSVPINFRFGALLTDQIGTRWLNGTNFGYWKTNSFRAPGEEINDRQIYGRMSHDVSNKFFYEFQANYYQTVNLLSDAFFKDKWFQYGDTSSNPGLTSQGSLLSSDPAYSGLFSKANRVYNLYKKTDVSYWGGKLDATWAINTKKYGDHEVKFGGEFRKHTLKKIELNPARLADNPKDSLGNLVYNPNDIWFGTNVLLNAYGYDIVKDQWGNQILSASEIKPKEPVVAAAYLRDKVDFGDFTFNAGVRMDYLDVATEVLKDPRNLIGADGEILSADDFEQNKAEVIFSPRLGFSFPVTDKTIFTAQFGKFVQMPPLDFLYINRQLFTNVAKGSISLQNVYENPNLKPEKLTSYEIGIKQQIGDYLNLGITAYYKETTDQIGAVNIPQIPGKVPSPFGLYANSDFSTSRGIDFYLSVRRINRLAVDIAYTLLYASGIGSDPNSRFSLANDPTGIQPTFVFPLDYDQRHTGSVNLDYRFGGESDVPKGFAGKLLQNLGFNVLFSFNSGRPYTLRQLPLATFGDDGGALSTKNGTYRSWNIKLDARIDKTVEIWKTKLNFFIYATNLLNTELINNVYGSTGLPDNNGYLNTPTGNQNATNPVYNQNWHDVMSAKIANWGPPRQVQFGVKMNF
ncbi:MAG: TonB-dependent receptor [Ignavibacteria bacterium]|nr:TonB-dependent receptor [Ignavibacteria bacterium]